MENQVKNNNTGLWVIVVILAMIIAGIVVFMFHHENTRVNEPSNVEDTILVDSTECELPTVDGIVEYRNLIKYNLKLDSTYLNMPEVALRAILQEYGTTLDANSIAEIYLQNPEKYKNIKTGADIQKTIMEKPNLISDDSLKTE